MSRRVATLGWTLLIAIGIAAPASAQQVVQSVEFGGGFFAPRGQDSRPANDVLVGDLDPANGDLAFRVRDFLGGEAHGEWNIGIGDHLEATFGGAFYAATAHSVYRDYTNSDGTEIEQRLHLRTVPLTAGIRFLPINKPGRFQPYVGAGVAFIPWKYTEDGDWIDFSDFSVFSQTYPSSGTAVGPFVMGGIKAPLNGDIYAFTVELRYTAAKGNLDPTQQFAGSVIDLSGLSTRFGLQIRF